MSNITKGNFEALKKLMVSTRGFQSWDFENDYTCLIIGFKNSKCAKNAINKSLAGCCEITAFGEITCENGLIIVELNRDAIQAMEG